MKYFIFVFDIKVYETLMLKPTLISRKFIKFCPMFQIFYALGRQKSYDWLTELANKFENIQYLYFQMTFRIDMSMHSYFECKKINENQINDKK